MTIIFKRLKRGEKEIEEYEETEENEENEETEEISDEFVYPKKISFNLNIPIMTGTFCDPIVNLSPRQRWDKGLDLNHSGGNFILSGNMY